MLSTMKSATAALVLLVFAQSTTAQIAGGQGCFSSSGDLVDQGPGQYTTSLSCQNICSGLNKPVIGLSGSDCWCGDKLPPQSSVTSLQDCNMNCNGFSEPCGGKNAWTVYLTNPNVNPGYSDGDSSSSSSSSSSQSKVTSSARPVSTQASVVTKGGSAVTVYQILTQTPDPASTPTPAADRPSGGGTNTGGIVAGVVVGVVALIAIIGGIWFFLKKRKNRMEGHQRVQSTNAFATAGAPSGFDARLDPSMVQRRDSTGSVFADNQDYSRRILRVANPDDR